MRSTVYDVPVVQHHNIHVFHRSRNTGMQGERKFKQPTRTLQNPLCPSKGKKILFGGEQRRIGGKPGVCVDMTCRIHNTTTHTSLFLLPCSIETTTTIHPYHHCTRKSSPLSLRPTSFNNRVSIPFFDASVNTQRVHCRA